jgi:predicted ATP-grasp superfamily ATP-dependent carboligase
VVALDLFGDLDTRRASAQWRGIGSPGAMRIDARLLLDALADLAARRAVDGWIVGSGFESQPELLERGAALLPLFGTAGGDVRRLRDPRTFFDTLDSAGIAHPAIRYDAPPSPEGWLLKDAGGCGGWHVRHAPLSSRRSLAPGMYFQRVAAGLPMSATFIAARDGAVVLGVNRQLVRPIGSHPYVYCGVVGPIPLPAVLRRTIERDVRVLAAAFGLRGLGSLDLVVDGGTCVVLEINPRPPASLALYPDVGGGVLTAHLRACRGATLPSAVALPERVRGTEIVFARRPLKLDAATAAAIAARPGCHDLPAAGTSFDAGDPVCSVSAEGADADAVEAALARARDDLISILETTA